MTARSAAIGPLLHYADIVSRGTGTQGRRMADVRADLCQLSAPMWWRWLDVHGYACGYRT
jgi:hypothetical protein